MIVGDIFSNLGNQLFIYAATKSIALDLGYEYRYQVIKPGFAENNDCIDAYGHEYSNDFERAFNIDISERINKVPDSIKENWTWQRTKDTNFIDDVYKIEDNTRLDGYFLCPQYFEHRRQQLLEWFRFKKEYLDRCTETRNVIIEKTAANHLVSVHVRCGKDYREQGQVIDPTYHIEAIKKVRKIFYDNKLCFLIFSDVPDLAKKLFENESHIIYHEGSMFEDLCLMTLCDSHIISNSTFSWWGAWLSESTKGIVIRPSIWPIGPKSLGPEDIFPSSWISVNSKRARLSISDSNRVNDVFRSTLKSKVKQVRRVVKKILKKLLPDLLFKKGA